MSFNIRKVVNVYVRDWIVGMKHFIDCSYPTVTYFVVVEDDHDEKWVHKVTFTDEATYEETDEGDYYVGKSYDSEPRAEELAKRVRDSGVIDLRYWEFHEFFSRTLEQRLGIEAHHEDMHRKGHGEYLTGIYSGGHE